MRKYTWIELLFAEWRIVRRLTRGFWVRELRGGVYGSWVKITDAERIVYSHLFGKGADDMFKFPEAETEDWRGGFFRGQFKKAQSVVRITDQAVFRNLQSQLKSVSPPQDLCSGPKADA